MNQVCSQQTKPAQVDSDRPGAFAVLCAIAKEINDTVGIQDNVLAPKEKRKSDVMCQGGQSKMINAQLSINLSTNVGKAKSPKVHEVDLIPKSSFEGFYCWICCGYVSSSLSSFGKHLTEHEQTRMCMICLKVMQPNEDLKKHIQENHELYLYKELNTCEKCAKNVIHCNDKPSDLLCQIIKLKTMEPPEIYKKRGDCKLKRTKQCILYKKHFSVCNICLTRSKINSEWESLNSHLTTYHPTFINKDNKTSYCNICAIPFKELKWQQSSIYQITCYFKPEEYKNLEKFAQVKCPICHHMCEDAYEVYVHSLFHLSSLFYNCDLCQASYKLKTPAEYIRKHRKSHGLSNFVQCKFCRREFDSIPAKRYHERKEHSNELQYKCDQCDRRCFDKSGLRSHLATAHKLYKYQCSTCMKKFQIKKVFKKHVENLKCENKYAFCHVCGEKIRKQGFERHMEHHQPKNTRCSLCPGSKMRTSISLKRHMAKVHVSKKPVKKKKTCEYCGNAFATNASLKSHILRHQGIKRFKCDQCEKAYYNSVSLTLHKRSAHTKERPFKCSYCPAAFTGPSNLQDHIRIHTGEKPYVCPACNKAFTKSCNMKKHIKLMHKKSGS